MQPSCSRLSASRAMDAIDRALAPYTQGHCPPRGRQSATCFTAPRRLIERDRLLVVGADYSLKVGLVDFFDTPQTELRGFWGVMGQRDETSEHVARRLRQP